MRIQVVRLCTGIHVFLVRTKPSSTSTWCTTRRLVVGELALLRQVKLFDVLAVVDACVSLLLAALVFGCLWLEMRFSGASAKPKKSPQVDQATLQLQHAFPECILHGRADLSKMGAKHHFLADIIFENGLSATVGEVKAAAKLLSAASDSVPKEEGIPEVGPMLMLTQVLKFLHILPFDKGMLCPCYSRRSLRLS